MPVRLRDLRVGDVMVPLGEGMRWPWDAWEVTEVTRGGRFGASIDLKRALYAVRDVDDPEFYEPEAEDWPSLMAFVASEWRRVVPRTLHETHIFLDDPKLRGTKERVVRVEEVPGEGALAYATIAIQDVRPVGAVPFERAESALAAAETLERFDLLPLELWQIRETPQRVGRALHTPAGHVEITHVLSTGCFEARLVVAVLTPCAGSWDEAYEMIRRAVASRRPH